MLVCKVLTYFIFSKYFKEFSLQSILAIRYSINEIKIYWFVQSFNKICFYKFIQSRVVISHALLIVSYNVKSIFSKTGQSVVDKV